MGRVRFLCYSQYFKSWLNRSYNMCHIFYNYNNLAKSKKSFKLNNNNTLTSERSIFTDKNIIHFIFFTNRNGVMN